MGLFPAQAALNEAFSSRHVFRQPVPEPAHQILPKPNYSIWSVAEDAKSKANALSAEAKAELSKASSSAQAKTGEIELYSPKFYVASIFGGAVACVGIKAFSAYN